MFPINSLLGGKAALAGIDVTPDTVAWSDINEGSVGTGYVQGSTITATFSGINSPINLKPSWTGAGQFAVNINGVPTSVSNGGLTPNINNGDIVYWTGTALSSSTFGVVTVKNNTDVGTPTLATFNYSLTII